LAAPGCELVVGVVVLDVVCERGEGVEGEVVAGGAVDAAVAVAGVDALSLLRADREAGALCGRVVAGVVASLLAGGAA